MYLETYYLSYLAICAALIFWLGWTFNRTGSILLSDAFGGNTQLVKAVAHLLNVGFYLVSIGFVGFTYEGIWQQLNTYTAVIQVVTLKVGGFLLMLGVAHLFNMMLLAIFRRRGGTANVTPGAGAAA
jgi:hypothetical protein